MSAFTYGWVRVEGPYIKDKETKYGHFVNIPDYFQVFYGTPEVQIYNKSDSPIAALTHGVAYKVVKLSSLGSYSTIADMDASWPVIQTKIDALDREVDIANGKGEYYNDPFVITESSIILYADSTDRWFVTYAIVLIDTYHTPTISMIIAEYKGSPVPVDETYDINDIKVTAVMDDRNTVTIASGFVVDPADRKITAVGVNTVTVAYIDGSGRRFEASLIITGIKRLTGITGVYDGPVVPYSREAERKYFVITASFSDGSSVTVTDFSFPYGNIVDEGNEGVISVYYKGFYTFVAVPTYTVSDSRLVAYYTGPPVEIGKKWLKSYAKVKIYYRDSTSLYSYYEDVSNESCTFTPETIDHEGLNQITVTFTGRCGTVSVKMVVIGFKPEVTMNFITAEYTGPDIVVGNVYSPERVKVKVHYSNGQVIQVRNFTTNSFIVESVGMNDFVCTYKERDTSLSTIFTVRGLERDDTTESGYNPISLLNNFPEMTMFNNRFRGPLEAQKHDHIAMMLYDNIHRLYKIFADIEHTFNKAVETINGINAVKYKTLDSIHQIHVSVDGWINDDRFTTGEYVKPEDD